MSFFPGHVVEIRLTDGGQRAALIECPSEVIPAAGEYLQAYVVSDKEAALATSIFAASPAMQAQEEGKAQFLTAAPVPPTWGPGTHLSLRGPLGRGFELPDHAKRVALIATESNADRLRSLAIQAIERGLETALFTDHAPPEMPSLVEINPLEDARDVFGWADYVAIDLQKKNLDGLRSDLDLQRSPKIGAQVLVRAQMPCGGLGDCGICWVKAKRGYKQACKDGPVFDLSEIDLSG